MYTNAKAEIDVYRYIENLIYGNFAQEIVEKNRLDLLRTSLEEFSDNIRKIMEKGNKAQCILVITKSQNTRYTQGKLRKK